MMTTRDRIVAMKDPYLEEPFNGSRSREHDKTKEYGFGVRHVQAILLFSYLVITFIARGHLGVTIVAMVNQVEEHYNINNNNIIDKAVKNVVKSFSNNRTIHFFNADGTLINQLYPKINNISMDDITIDIQNNTIRPHLNHNVGKKTRFAKYNLTVKDKMTDWHSVNKKLIDSLFTDQAKPIQLRPDLKKSIVHYVNTQNKSEPSLDPKETLKKNKLQVALKMRNTMITNTYSSTTDYNYNKSISKWSMLTTKSVDKKKALHSRLKHNLTWNANTKNFNKRIDNTTTELYTFFTPITNTIITKSLKPKTAYIGFVKVTDKPMRRRSLPSSSTDDRERLINDVQSWRIFRTYSWQKSEQESVQGAFFFGYFLLMLPMGMLCQRVGGKLPMQISLLVNGVVSLAAPWVIAWGGWQAACACRVVQGLAQTGTYPATMSMCAAWIPQSERGSLCTYIFSGTVVGTVIAYQVGGFLASTAGGWPSIFWFSGMLCLLGFGLITIFSSATPQENKFITEEEKAFIRGQTKFVSVKKTKVPWTAAFLSKHVWAIFATHIGSGVSFFYLFTQVPSYLNYILGYKLKDSGLLSCLPYIANFIASLLFGFLSDFCCNRNYISVKFTRIIYNSIACFGMAFSMILLSFVKSPVLGVTFFTLALFTHAGIYVGWMINYMDICPNYSSSLVAVGNTLMNVVMIIMPMIVNKVVVDVYSVTQWRTMLCLVSAVTAACNIIYVCFMSTDLQPWNNCQLPEQNQERGATRRERRLNEN